MILGLNPDSVLGSLSSNQTTLFTAYLHDLGTKSRFSFRILIFKKRMGQMSTKASNLRCKINFGNLTFRVLVLQTTLFPVYLHDLGTKSRFSFWILILQTTWFTAYCMISGPECSYIVWSSTMTKNLRRNLSPFAVLEARISSVQVSGTTSLPVHLSSKKRSIISYNPHTIPSGINNHW